MKTHIYRLVPAAGPRDPNWDRALNQGEVIVRAVSSGEARMLAANAEAAAITLKIPLATTKLMASAFRDVNLYTVQDDTSGRFSDDGPCEVLEGTFQIPLDI